MAVDLGTSAKRAYGSPCTQHDECEGGFCILESEHPIFVGGFCAKECTAGGNECDANKEACEVGWNACLRVCYPDACPTGLSCIVNGTVCLPPLKQLVDASRLCDPTKRTNANCAPGQICRRWEHADDGDGADKGICEDTCIVGTDTCEGANAACRVEDNSKLPMREGQLNYTSDVGIAPVCRAVATTANPAGTACRMTSAGDEYSVSHACEDRAQCALATATLAWLGIPQTLASDPDDLCHVLCYKDGAIPTPPEGQLGTPFTACPGGTTCADSFGMFANPYGLPEVGLCR